LTVITTGLNFLYINCFWLFLLRQGV
jgi:hypothetical protein